MTNFTVRNGVSGILIPLSFHSSEALEPVLINTQIAVYTDNRNVVIDSMAVKEMIKNSQEQAQADKVAFRPGMFLKEFHEEFSHDLTKMNMLLGFFYKGRTFPISIAHEYKGGDRYSTVTQAVYTDPVKQATIDVKYKAGTNTDFKLVLDILIETSKELEGETLNITDTAFYIKHRIEQDLTLEVQEVFIKKGANITIIGG